MRTRCLLSAVVVVLTVLVAADAAVAQKKGHGAGGRSISKPHGTTANRGASPKIHRAATGVASLDSGPSLGTVRDRQHLVEQRKLQHRLGTADHLENVADRNGNENLRTTAQRMRERAHEHYEKRMQKIGDQSDNPPGEELPENGGVESLPGVPEKLTGLENALARQFRNEERKLMQRMDAAQRLYDLAEQTGDPELLDSAERMHQSALDHYYQRMDAIQRFQQTHGLPEFEPLEPSTPTSAANPHQ